MKKKVLSLLVAFAMLFSMLPATALAAGEAVELPEGVKLTLADGVTAGNVTVAGPVLGVLDIGVVMDDDNVENDSYIYFDLSSLNAQKSIEIKLYSGNTLLSTTVLVNGKYLSYKALSATVEITHESSSWDTTWAVEPISNLIPNKAELYVDDTLADTVNQINMYSTDFPENAREWKDIEGVYTAPEGTITPAYTRSDAFWGEGTANATKSFVVELYEGNKKIASSSLRNKDIIDGEVYVTWSIPFDGEDSDYWDVEWAEGYPKYDMNPDKVKLIADGTQVATNNVQYNAPDNLNKIVALAGGNTGGVVAYTSLQAAIDAVEEGETVKLLDDVTISEGNNAVVITRGVSFTLDLNGKTLTGNTANAAILANINNDDVTESVTINIKNGTVTAGPSAFCALIPAGKSEDVTLTVNLDDVALNGSNSDGCVVKVFANAIVNVNDGTVITGADSYGCMEVMGVANIYDGAKLYQNGTTSYNGCIVGVSYGGVANIYDGEGNSANTGLIVMTSGGTINVRGGEWTAKTVLTAQNDKNSYPNGSDSIINVYDGIFTGAIRDTTNGDGSVSKTTISGGVYTVDPTKYLADGYGAVKYGETYGVTVAPQVTMVAQINGGTKYQTIEAAIDAAKAGDTVTIFAGEHTGDVTVNKGITVVGETDASGNNLVTINGKLSVTGNGATVKNLNVNNSSERAVYVAGGNILIEGCNLTGVHGLRYCYANNGDVTLKDCVITGSTYGVHFDGGSGDGDVIIDGCTITGWTSFGSDVEEVTITNTTFVDGNYNLLRFYQNATLTNVTIPSGDHADYQGSGMRIDTGTDGAGMDGITITMTGCKTADGSLFEGALDPDTYEKSNFYVDGVLMGAVARINETYYKTLDEAFSEADDGDEVEILAPGTYELNTSGKDITITGSVDGVVFDNIGAKRMDGANVTFNKVTFDYYPNGNYTGLQHSGNLTYNNCIINGQVFLYGTSETFNNCTFNQNSADAYNVWTYGAKAVKFNECTFNSFGKSVLVYNEGAGATDLTVTDTDFIASAPVEGKAAIEIDTTLMPDGTDIMIDDKTTATGFGTGSVSGNSLWNDKKEQTNLTVTVSGEQVWPRGKAVIDHGFQTIIDNSKPRESITTTLKNVYASESLVLKIYSGETLLGTTTLREYEDGDTDKPLYPATYTECTVNNVITGKPSGSWETMWDVELTRKNVPTKIEVYADGVLTNTYENTNGCFLNDEEKAEYIELFDLTFTVTFDTNGGSSVDAQEVVSGALATRPASAPTKSGYTFVNWYSDEALTTVFDFSEPITADTTIYAKWSRNSFGGGGGGGSYNPSYTITVEDTENGDITVSPSRASSGSTVTITVDPDSGYELDELTVLDKNGKEIKLTRKSDSKYTFKMPSGKVTVEATFAEIEAFENPFTDVAEGAYYYDAVLWAAENGITGGTSATTFSPAVTCTRAQTVTFLWRAAGSPDPEGTNMPFTDVASDAYYYDAVLWAVENGITSGTSATTFSPNATVTRAQNVTFLWRWAESPAVEAVNPFTDVAADMYYHDAVLWAAEEGITAGTSATTFSPDDPCLRSQIVTFLYRYLVK